MYHTSARGGKITYPPEKTLSYVTSLFFIRWKVSCESENFEKEYHEWCISDMSHIALEGASSVFA